MNAMDTTVVAKLLFRSKPDPEGGTVGEKQLWAKMTAQFRNHFRDSVVGFNVETFDTFTENG